MSASRYTAPTAIGALSGGAGAIGGTVIGALNIRLMNNGLTILGLVIVLVIRRQGDRNRACVMLDKWRQKHQAN